MEGQAFGIPPSYGGPYVGVIATREKFVRQMPGRLAGETKDAEGNRGFVLTLATREQHIRREKATSNICTNEALYALAATIHLCLIGKEGIREQALQNLAKARFAQTELEKIPGVRRIFSGRTFNEFTRGISALGETDQSRIAQRKNRRPVFARHALSRAHQKRGGLRHRNHQPRGNRTLRRGDAKNSG